MSELVELLLLTSLAGAAIPIGGFLATVERIHPDWLELEFRHSVVAFGGGVLLSAVSLVLVPEGTKVLSLPWVIGAFLAGGLVFFALDAALARSTSSLSQLVAMLSDFLPEAMAMGAAFAVGGDSGLLLAILIALQNLPEGFNAYRELAASGKSSPRAILVSFMMLAPLGPAAGAAGYFWLAPYPHVVAFIMLFAASGILFLTFQDIAPQAQLKNRMAPSLGAVLGFLLGLVGQLITAPHA